LDILLMADLIECLILRLKCSLSCSEGTSTSTNHK
jgi:hypothetical protein